MKEKHRETEDDYGAVRYRAARAVNFPSSHLSVRSHAHSTSTTMPFSRSRAGFSTERNPSSCSLSPSLLSPYAYREQVAIDHTRDRLTARQSSSYAAWRMSWKSTVH